MHKLLAVALIIVALTSCKQSKLGDPTPTKGTSGGGTTDGTTGGTTDNSNAAQYTVKLNIANQVVNTSVGHDTLFLVYTEKADIILNKSEYESSSAVHFKEDFSKSNLANFHFIALNSNEEYATDYVDDNLNNVKLKTASTVVIDGKNFVNLHLERVFIFYKAYKQAALAAEAQANILKADKDVITFSSYIYDKKNYDTTTATATVSYTRID
ncbi:hypothetical protein [Mucilaginibacter sp. SP1R1]|uniref:hypothetical protein n=1 Tax=Mucilaginibacter sp. SP1R1 TaxID=2723091 RepID=UPI00161BB128|nr:hypothetical protein [Mucilaginibacter sp. SP1R1]MBB6151013.1 hypothetical protein [Mucilaginibacter sp. SP1R1]